MRPKASARCASRQVAFRNCTTTCRVWLRYRKSEPTNVGRLDESSCPYTLHPSQDAARQVRYGLLVVPQDRRGPSGPVVRVPYAVFKSPQPSELAPVVYLTGGPGPT